MLQAATSGGSVVLVDASPIVSERAYRWQWYGYWPRQSSLRTGLLPAGWPDGAPYDLVGGAVPVRLAAQRVVFDEAAGFVLPSTGTAVLRRPQPALGTRVERRR